MFHSPGIVLPDDLYSLNLMVVPMWGLYANMIAQLLSQVSSHFIVHYHRLIVATATPDVERRMLPHIETAQTLDDDEGGSFQCSSPLPVHARSSERPTKLCGHAFTRPHRGETDKLVARRYVSVLLIATAVTVSTLVIAGCILPSFSIHVLGIIGVLVESGQNFEDAVTEYSLFRVVQMLFDQAAFTGKASDYVGLGSLSILMVLSVLLVPVAQALCLLFNWFFALSSKSRQRLSVGIEVLAAWQYTEVYLLAVVVASWYVSCYDWCLLSRVIDSVSSSLYFLLPPGNWVQSPTS